MYEIGKRMDAGDDENLFTRASEGNPADRETNSCTTLRGNEEVSRTNAQSKLNHSTRNFSYQI